MSKTEKTKLVVAVALGFHGQLREPGTLSATFSIPADEELGSWMRLAGDAPAAADTTAPTDPGAGTGGHLLQTPPPPRYVIKHIAAGNWKVVDVQDDKGEPVGDVFKRADHDDKAKEAAQLKADQLNAEAAKGVAPAAPEAPIVPSPPGPPGGEQPGGLPDA